MNKIPFWIWLLGFVIAGCVFEYFWLVGFERLDRHMTRKQKLVTGVVLLCIAATAFSYGLFWAYHE